MTIIPKKWGYEKWIVNKSYCGKLLFFERGKGCSYHFHQVKDEIFYVQSGVVKIEYGDGDQIENANIVFLSAGETFAVPPLLRHRMTGVTDVELFEFSTQHFEDDSYRIIKS